MSLPATGLLLLALLPTASTVAPPVPFPAGFRDWHHVKTVVVQPGHPLYAAIGGINHVYANAAAMQGYRDGRFPEGSVLVFDTIEAREAAHAISEGERKVLGVMVKDSRRYPGTGGWGFENFDGGRAASPMIGDKAAAMCFGCHNRPGTRDHVFSRLRE